jgi:phosphatidylglycerol:prolipoprotein diacylglycerol transferase
MALGLALGRVGCFMAGCCWGDVCIDSYEVTKLSAKISAWQLQTVPLISHPGFPWAVRFPVGAGAFEQHQELGLIGATDGLSRPVHPVQLYEAALALALCLLLHLRFQKRRWQGQVFCWLIGSYAVIRFGTEFLRADNAPLYLGLTLSQVISVILGLSAGSALIWRKGQANLKSIPPSSEPKNMLESSVET